MGNESLLRDTPVWTAIPMVPAQSLQWLRQGELFWSSPWYKWESVWVSHPCCRMLTAQKT